MVKEVNSLFSESELDRLHARARELHAGGGEVLYCSMINPDLPPPRLLLDKLVEAAMKPVTHRYAVSRGIARLRQAFSERYQRIFSVQVNPESECCVTLGAKDAVVSYLRALRACGDLPSGGVVLLPTPCYPAHIAAVQLAELTPFFVPIEPGMTDEQIAARWEDALALHPRSAVLLNFPHNPTGRVLSAEALARIVAACRGSNSTLLNDFAYGELSFRYAPAPSVLASLSGGLSGSRVVEVYTMSKAWSVPGWRVAGLCGDGEIIRKVAKLKSWSDYGQFLPVQMAAAAALESPADLTEDARGVYRRRTEVLSHGLRAAGWFVDGAPQSGVSVWGRAPDGWRSGQRSAAEQLLLSARVMAMPGQIFGGSFDGWVRFAAVLPEEKLRALLSRLSVASQSEARV